MNELQQQQNDSLCSYICCNVHTFKWLIRIFHSKKVSAALSLIRSCVRSEFQYFHFEYASMYAQAHTHTHRERFRHIDTFPHTHKMLFAVFVKMLCVVYINVRYSNVQFILSHIIFGSLKKLLNEEQLYMKFHCSYSPKWAIYSLLIIFNVNFGLSAKAFRLN